jgi:hypothetical protein
MDGHDLFLRAIIAVFFFAAAAWTLFTTRRVNALEREVQALRSRCGALESLPTNGREELERYTAERAMSPARSIFDVQRMESPEW